MGVKPTDPMHAVKNKPGNITNALGGPQGRRDRETLMELQQRADDMKKRARKKRQQFDEMMK